MRIASALRLTGVVAAIAFACAACSGEGKDEAGGDRPQTPASTKLAFTDVTGEVGLDFRHGAFRWDVSPDVAAMMGGGLCWLDYDSDGWQDLFVVNSYAEAETGRWQQAGGLPHSVLYRNAEGRFEDVSVDADADLAMRGNGCVAADFDLDGHTDLYVTTSRVNALLWNDGDGTFTEGAVDAGVAAYGWRTGTAVGDVNGDGWPDLFVAGYADLLNSNPDAVEGFPNTYFGVRDLLFLNEGRGDGGRVTFREVGVDAGLEVVKFEYGLGAVMSDLDHDGDIDVYVANDTNPNRLYENVAWPGGPEADPAGIGFRFEERAAAAGVADPNAGMGIAVADYDGDGGSDLFVTNARSQTHSAYRSLPADENAPSWLDVRLELGADWSGSTGWGASWADFDLDGDPDLLLANGHVPVTNLAADAERVQLFENLNGERFVEVGQAAGLGKLGRLLGRGSATADYDNDGDLDVVMATIGGRLVLLENSGARGNWLEVAVDGFRPGTAVTAELPGGRKLLRDSVVGSSYLSSEDPRLHFGLGNAATVTRLRVRWPGGEETTVEDVAANQLVVVEPPQ